MTLPHYTNCFKELGRLRRREIDLDAVLDRSYAGLRKAQREACPSPASPEKKPKGEACPEAKETKAEPSQGSQVMSGFTSINRPRADSTRPKTDPVLERVRQPTSPENRKHGARESPAKPSACTKSAAKTTTSPMPLMPKKDTVDYSVASAGRPKLEENTQHAPIIQCLQMSDRDWDVVEISQSRLLVGIREYLTLWADTRHELPMFHLGEDDVVQVKINDTIFDVDTHRRRSDFEVDLHWSATWHCMWELSSAYQVVEECHRREELDPPYHSSCCDGILPPETISLPIHTQPLESLAFRPRSKVDYTIALMLLVVPKLQEHSEEIRGPHKPLSEYLNRPVRQRLVFRDKFHALPYNATLPDKLRALHVYVVGEAQVKPCSYCVGGGGPFPKCVRLKGCFKGVCTNCAYSRRGTSCEHHLDQFREYIGTPKVSHNSASGFPSTARKPAVDSTPAHHYTATSPPAAAQAATDLTSRSPSPLPDSLTLLKSHKHASSSQNALPTPPSSSSPPRDTGDQPQGVASASYDSATRDSSQSRGGLGFAARTSKRKSSVRDHSSKRSRRSISAVRRYPSPEVEEPEVAIVIHSDKRLKSGGASEAEVRHLLTLANAHELEDFEAAWREGEEMDRQSLEDETDELFFKSKEHFISVVLVDMLNVIIRERCPRQIIDLTGDD